MIVFLFAYRKLTLCQALTFALLLAATDCLSTPQSVSLKEISWQHKSLDGVKKGCWFWTSCQSQQPPTSRSRNPVHGCKTETNEIQPTAPQRRTNFHLINHASWPPFQKLFRSEQLVRLKHMENKCVWSCVSVVRNREGVERSPLQNWSAVVQLFHREAERHKYLRRLKARWRCSQCATALQASHWLVYAEKTTAALGTGWLGHLDRY